MTHEQELEIARMRVRLLELERDAARAKLSLAIAQVNAPSRSRRARKREASEARLPGLYYTQPLVVVFKRDDRVDTMTRVVRNAFNGKKHFGKIRTKYGQRKRASASRLEKLYREALD